MRYFLPQVLAVLFILLTTNASAKPKDIPKSIRYLIVHNEMDQTIYPVIESPEDGNCQRGSTDVQRLLIPGGVTNGQTIKVYMPDKCWYRAGRILIFTANITSFEERINENQQTQKNGVGPCYRYNSNGSDGSAIPCYTGIAHASYPLDSPAQLTEYTFDADDPNTGKPSPDPDKGRLMADIDLSYVDETFLPVAMAIDTGGLAGYMGTTQSYDVFKQRIDNFKTSAGWSTFAAYTQENWPNNVFHDLVPFSYHIMGGYNLINNVNTKATSSLYKLTNPAPGQDTYLIENLSVNQNYQPSNPSETALVAKWKQWLAPNNPCSNSQFLDNPAVDKLAFCQDFQSTVQWVWNAYLGYKAKDPNYCKFVGGDSKPYTLDDTSCLMQHIIGYTQGPNSGQLPESVQAILRSVPWNTPPKDPNQAPAKPLYQYDKWLLFWAPVTSPYNLDPFTRLIHNPDDGIDAVAYSFSIDDKYGNFRDEGLGLIIDVGGSALLPNKSMYDPYQQYYVSWAAGNWDHAVVCGRRLSINKLAGNARVSMWNNGVEQESCNIVLYPSASEQDHLNFQLSLEPMRTVIDAYTGLQQQVQGLTMNVNYCKNNSSASLSAYCTQANLTPVYSGEIAYVSLSDADKPKTTLNVATLLVGGRLNLAPGWLSASGCGLPSVAGKLDPTKGYSFTLTPGTQSCRFLVSANTVNANINLQFNSNGDIIPQTVNCTNGNNQACKGVYADPHNINLPPPNAV